MKLNLLTVALACGLLMACEQNDGTTISGKVENAEGLKVTLLRYSKSTPDTLGSKILKASGDFSFDVSPGRLEFYTLAVGDIPPIFLAIDSTAEQVTVNGDFKTLKETYEISGSADSEDIRNFFVQGNIYEQRLDSTMKILQEAAASGDQDLRVRLGNYYNETRKNYRNYLVDHIANKPTSAANYSILQRLNPEEDIDKYRAVRDGLAAKMEGYFYFDVLADKVAQVEQQLELANFLAPGTQAPDIVLPDQNGNNIALSSLKGKYVLIDFWASWCKPCRMENPNVVKMYNKYKSKNFEIYGVSLDKDRSKWLEAIQQDKLTWPHVSDLQYWNSAAAKLYNVTGIPFTVLIDPDGKVVQKNLRGAALEMKMQEIFGV